MSKGNLSHWSFRATNLEALRFDWFLTQVTVLAIKKKWLWFLYVILLNKPLALGPQLSVLQCEEPWNESN